MRQLTSFAEQFRDINRRVCIETVFIYRLTADRQFTDIAPSLIPPTLLEQMNRCHHARQSGRSLSDDERRNLFTAFFLWEQAEIVGPSIKEAFATFDWPLIRGMALKPKICFSYFRHTSLAFQDFNDASERIEKGLAAFDRACSRGWSEVERSLNDYAIMPHHFKTNPSEFYSTVQRSIDGEPKLALS